MEDCNLSETGRDHIDIMVEGALSTTQKYHVTAPWKTAIQLYLSADGCITVTPVEAPLGSSVRLLKRPLDHRYAC